MLLPAPPFLHTVESHQEVVLPTVGTSSHIN